MKLYAENKSYKLYNGNMLDMLDVVEPESVGSIVTDPPYGLTSIVKRCGKSNSAPIGGCEDGRFARLSKGFMGKEWDGSGIEYDINTWRKCYDVLKPGGYLLAFGGSRTFHRIACAIEDAGFEIRDTIMWLYGSGFPKSMNIGLALDKRNGVDNRTGNINKGAGSNNTESRRDYSPVYEERKATNKWGGYGTALKPAFEPIIVARKPFKGSLIDNIERYGVGGLNIDECRVKHNEDLKFTERKPKSGEVFNTENSGYDNTNNHIASAAPEGRFPANVILTWEQITFDEVCGNMPNTKSRGGKTSMPDLRDIGQKSKESIGIDKLSFGQVSGAKRKESDYTAPCDEGSACRYFYCAKASTKDRDEGLNVELTQITDGSLRANQETGRICAENPAIKKNIHPTVKPTELMQYLVRLVTPKGETILDPFNGSGSTGKAVMYENRERNANYKYIGIELTEEYLPIAKSRIEYASGI